MKGEKLQEYPKLLLSKSELHHFFFDQFCPIVSVRQNISAFVMLTENSDVL